MRYKDEKKIDNIFMATLSLINENGFSGVSMSKIAKIANISASTIYVYFNNKEELLLKLYVYIKTKLNFAVYNDIDKSINFKTTYEIVLKKFINFINNNKDYFLFIEQFQNSPIIKSISEEEVRQIIGPVEDLYSIGREQRVIKDIGSNLFIIYTFYPAMQFVKEQFNSNSNLKGEDINSIIRLSWDAIKV